ncbi:MAG: hypothetical protein ACK5Y2_03155 [Bdellovibrionales bacterium]
MKIGIFATRSFSFSAFGISRFWLNGGDAAELKKLENIRTSPQMIYVLETLKDTIKINSKALNDPSKLRDFVFIRTFPQLTSRGLIKQVEALSAQYFIPQEQIFIAGNGGHSLDAAKTSGLPYFLCLWNSYGTEYHKQQEVVFRQLKRKRMKRSKLILGLSFEVAEAKTAQYKVLPHTAFNLQGTAIEVVEQIQRVRELRLADEILLTHPSPSVDQISRSFQTLGSLIK